MRLLEYEKPPRATKEMIDAFEKKNELPDKVCQLPRPKGRGL